jgi:hypothetical protein
MKSKLNKNTIPVIHKKIATEPEYISALNKKRNPALQA